MLKTKVIVTDINNLTDARYFAAWGVDLMAFVIDAGLEKQLSVEEINSFMNWVEGPAFALQLKNDIEVDVLFEYLERTGINKLILTPPLHNRLKGTFGESQFYIIEDQNIYAESLTYSYVESVSQLNALDLNTVHGIYVKGGAEEKTGFKSFDEIDEVFEALEVF